MSTFLRLRLFFLVRSQQLKRYEPLKFFLSKTGELFTNEIYLTKNQGGFRACQNRLNNSHLWMSQHSFGDWSV